jgi:hypothetical protein
MALMHGDTLVAVGPHRCAAFPFTIEIETAPKSLFFPKFQHVSVGPTSNVGTAVIRIIELPPYHYGAIFQKANRIASGNDGG